MSPAVMMYGLDLLILLLAVVGALFARPGTRKKPMPQWYLLIPGLASLLCTVILLSYPDIRDLADPQMWMIGFVGVAIGAARGWAMRMDCDHAYALVRLRHGADAAWAAWILVLLATLQGVIETGLRADNPYEATAELVMLIVGGYLLGRSVVGWLRARSGAHVDLLEE